MCPKPIEPYTAGWALNSTNGQSSLIAQLPNYQNRCYTSAMYKAALALLVGLMLSVSGSAWGEFTFKDGVISPSTEVKPDLRSMLDRKLCEKAAWKINNQSLTTVMFSPIYRWRGTEA